MINKGAVAEPVSSSEGLSRSRYGTPPSSGARVATKTCSRCKLTKPGSEFYPRRTTKDGLTSACATCMRIAGKANYAAHKDDYKRRAIERRRQMLAGELPKEVVEKHRKSRASQHARWSAAYPWKAKASAAVRRAVASGRIVKPTACSECGKCGLIHGHHDDYEKPLVVRWLCPMCHSRVDAERIKLDSAMVRVAEVAFFCAP